VQHRRKRSHGNRTQAGSQATPWLTIEPMARSRKDLNSLIILGAWTLWKHRNRCVFDGIAPSSAACLAHVDEERRMWELVRAKGISFLMAHSQLSRGSFSLKNGCRCNLRVECGVWGHDVWALALLFFLL
jgi:hypothetical protein